MAELVETQVSRYPAYKPTGVEWMPEIPVRWEVKKLKIFIEDLESGVSVNSFDEPVIGDELGILKTSCVYSYKFDHSENKKVLAEEVDRVRVPVKGDTLIISRMNTPDLVGASGYVGKDFPNLFLPDRLWQTVFRQNTQFKCFPKWLSYVFVSAPFRMLITSLATGTSPSMKNISKEEVLNIQVGLPAFEEQRAIAFFLDDKTAQLDQLITQKQQMLELLREERAALINHAVTKGLDAAAPLRDSGVEWLGEVPAHWAVKRLKFISPSISVGLVINPSTYHDDNGTVPMISGKNVTENGIDIRNVKFITEESSKALLPSKLNAGDLVSIRVGYPGLTAVVPEELDGINCASVMIIRKGPGFHSPFLSMLMNSQIGVQQVDVVAYGSAQKQFNVGHAIEFVFPLPPLEEQLAISEEVNKRESKIAETTETINQEIALLQEYRAALIAEAVTGQIDVRDYAPMVAVLP